MADNRGDCGSGPPTNPVVDEESAGNDSVSVGCSCWGAEVVLLPVEGTAVEESGECNGSCFTENQEEVVDLSIRSEESITLQASRWINIDSIQD